MNFMLRGLIQISTEGRSLALVTLTQSNAYKIFAGEVMGVPLQVVWVLLFVVICSLIYNRHRFGVRVHIVGDNPDAAKQMGIDVRKVRLQTFVFVGLGAALAGVFAVFINYTWWPTSGESFLLPGLASVFVGGTAPWGGIGTVIGCAIGGKEASVKIESIKRAGYDLLWVEDPILRHDFEGLRMLRSSIPYTMINSGEYPDAAGKRQLLLAGVMRIGSFAAEMGIPVPLGNTFLEFGVHMARALPEVEWLEYSFQNLDALVEEPIEIRDGWAIAPDRPGHGLVLSEHARRQMARTN